MTNEIKYKLFKPLAMANGLTFNEKLVAMFVYTLHFSGKRCTASNKSIANYLNISVESVERAIIKLVKHCLIADFRKEFNYIEVQNLAICKKDYYFFSSNILFSSLNISSKFLLVYLQSFRRNGFVFQPERYNLSNNIGLDDERETSSSFNQLVEYNLLIEYVLLDKTKSYSIKQNINSIIKRYENKKN